MLTITTDGPHYRVADPSWSDPLDTSFAAKKGGRWNPIGLGALYLNASREAALANARRSVRDLWNQSLDDIRPDRLPDLQLVRVLPGGSYLDVCTPAGIAALGLPPDFPGAVPHPPCQALAAGAFAARLDGVLPLSAVAPTQRELVVFEPSVARLLERGDRVRWPWR